MKYLKRALLLLACATLLICVGCKTETYYFYTNIPSGGFEISDKNYKLNAIIDGCTYVAPSYEVDKFEYTVKNRQYWAMAANAEMVVAVDLSQEDAEDRYTQFYTAVGKALTDIDNALSSTIKTSDIYYFNEKGAGAEIEISEIAYTVLSTALKVYKMTDGYYNPALYYNIQAYGFGGAADYPHNAAQLPKDEDIANYTELAQSFGDISLREQGGKYYVKKPAKTVQVDGETLSLKLDLGGIGKGYAVDVIEELFKDFGYEYGYFNFAQSSMLVKSHITEGTFNIYLSGARSLARDPYMMVKVRNEKISSSGDDEKYYVLDGTRYCHIIDPTTGKPVQTGIMSATVIGGSAAEDDALTTAIMAMGKDKATQFIKEKLTDRRVVFTCE